MAKPAQKSAKSRRIYPAATIRRFADRLIQARMAAYGGEALTNQNYFRLSVRIKEDTGQALGDSALCRYEKGQRVPAPKQMAILSRAYRVPIEEMFRWLNDDFVAGQASPSAIHRDAPQSGADLPLGFDADRHARIRRLRANIAELAAQLDREFAALEADATPPARPRRRAHRG